MVKKGDEARAELLAGVHYGADAVARTLGPYGRNWISGIRGGTPHITNDGVSILKELWLPNEIQMLGLRTMREAALKLNELCGDGTSSAAVMTYAIVYEGMKRLGVKITDPASGKYEQTTLIGAPSVMDLKRQIDREAGLVIEALKKMAKPVESEEELVGAVRVSVEDEELAHLIGAMQWQLGPSGTILVEDTNEPTDSIERINGIRFDNGFPTSEFVNNFEKGLLELDEVPVIMTNATIGSISDFRGESQDKKEVGVISAIVQNLKTAGKKTQIVVIARKFDQLFMAEVAQNMKNGIIIIPINAPYVNQTQIFKDLAALLGGTFADVAERGRSLRDLTLSDIGFATKVQASRWNAIFAGVNDEKAQNRINARIEVLIKELKGEASPFARKMLEDRIASLTTGIGTMKVGALSETEQKRKRDKVDDAVASARSSLQEGLVPGAGMAFMRAAAVLPADALLRGPLEAIYKRVQENAGGYLMIEDWVKDPVKVCRLVVEKAASVAGDLLTAEGAIDHEHPKPQWVRQEPMSEDLGPDGTPKE